MRFTRAERESFRDATIPDLVGPGLRVLFVGINPGLSTSATGTPFARAGNRVWPALVAAGILSRLPAYEPERPQRPRHRALARPR